MKQEQSLAFQNRGLDQRMTALVTDDPSAVLPARWPTHIPLIHITTCGRLDIAVLHAITTDAAGASQGVYGPLDGRQRIEKGSATALRLLCLLASQSRGFASRDLISEKLRRFPPEGDKENDESDGLKRVDNVVSRLRRLLLPPLLKTLPEAMPVRQRLVTFHRATSESGPGYQLCGLPLIWLDAQVIQDAAKRARVLTQFGQEGTAEWQTVYELASLGPFLKEEVYSDWPLMKRQEIETHCWDAVQVLTRQYAEQGEAGKREALRLLRDYWMQHVTNEDAIRPLLEQLAKREGFGQAEAYYAQLCRVLDQEGRQPDRRTQETMEFVRAEQIQREHATISSVTIESDFASRINSSLNTQEPRETQNMDQIRRQLLQNVTKSIEVALFSPALLALIEEQSTLSFSVSLEESLKQWEASVKGCWHLLKGGGLIVAEEILASITPTLQKLITQESKYQQRIARIGTETSILCASIAMHKLQFTKREFYCLEAARYGHLSEDKKLHAAALMYLGYTYSFCKPLKPQKALDIFLEALHILGDEDQLLRSDLCMGLADAHAQCSQEKQALQYIEEAQNSFPLYPEKAVSSLYAGCDLSVLYQWEGKMYLELASHYPDKGYQQKAWNAFISGIDAQSSLAYSTNETIIYRADTARVLGDLDLCTTLLREGTHIAITLGSQKRYSEARDVFLKIPDSWQKEDQIKILGKELFRR